MSDKQKTCTSYSLPWRTLPGALPEDIEIFAIGDVHGQADLLSYVLDEIKKTAREASMRHLVFLGDLIDRGPASVRAVDLAMRGAELAGVEALHVLPGNHDIAVSFGLLRPELLSTWISGGGQTVLSELGISDKTHSSAVIIETLREALNPDYLMKIEHGPSHLWLGDLIFVHAGVHPYGDIAEFLDQDPFFWGVDDHWATMRYPFLSHEGGWDERDPDTERRARRPTVIVHGHTPAIRRDLAENADLLICDGIDSHRTLALDIGAAYRPQMAWAHFSMRGDSAGVQLHAIRYLPA